MNQLYCVFSHENWIDDTFFFIIFGNWKHFHILVPIEQRKKKEKKSAYKKSVMIR